MNKEHGEGIFSSCATNQKLIFLYVPYELTIFQSLRGQFSLTTLVCKGDGWIWQLFANDSEYKDGPASCKDEGPWLRADILFSQIFAKKDRDQHKVWFLQMDQLVEKRFVRDSVMKFFLLQTFANRAVLHHISFLQMIRIGLNWLLQRGWPVTILCFCKWSWSFGWVHILQREPSVVTFVFANDQNNWSARCKKEGPWLHDDILFFNPLQQHGLVWCLVCKWSGWAGISSWKEDGQ